MAVSGGCCNHRGVELEFVICQSVEGKKRITPQPVINHRWFVCFLCHQYLFTISIRYQLLLVTTDSLVSPISHRGCQAS